MRKGPTFRDVARLARVSPATVTRVAQAHASVDSELRRRVREAASKLGVTLGERAAEESRILVFLLGNRDVLNSFQAHVMVGAETYCAAAGWELVSVSFRYDSAAPPRDLRLPQILTRRNVARSLVLAGLNYPNLLAALRERDLSFSVLGNNVVGDWQPTDYDVVYSNDLQGAIDLTRHLLSLGHRDIWFIGDTLLPWFSRCAEGYQLAMREAGLPARQSEIHSDGQELGYLATKSLLASRQRVTAIFAGTDQVARGVYAALRESGVGVPGDISVAGFNDTEAEILEPALTSVREFPEEQGRHLADFALQRVANGSLPARQFTIPTQLQIRNSTARPRRRGGA